MRRLAASTSLVLAVAAAALVPASMARADAVTTRIETRPYYGAVVTIEQGVRVWRALPPHDRIIIVPEGAKNVRVNLHVGGQAAAPPVSLNSNVSVSQAIGGAGSGDVGLPYFVGPGRGHGGGHHGRTHGTVRSLPYTAPRRHH